MKKCLYYNDDCEECKSETRMVDEVLPNHFLGSEPNLDEQNEITRLKLLRLINNLQDVWLEDNDSWYGTTTTIPEIQALIVKQVKEAKRKFMSDICDVEATREAEGKDFISWKAFERIKAIGDDK